MQNRIAKFRWHDKQEKFPTLYFGGIIIGGLMPIHPNGNLHMRDYKIVQNMDNFIYTYFFFAYPYSERFFPTHPDNHLLALTFKTQKEAEKALKEFALKLCKNDSWIRYTMKYELGE